jgi:hypothetical protein
MSSPQRKVFFDTIDKPDAKFLLLAVHGENGHPRTETHNQMATVARFKFAPLFLQPPFEL